MNLILGIIIGMCVSILIFTILAFFRAGIEKRVKIIETQLMNAGPKQKGAIIFPDDESEIARREYIQKNSREGKDTPISELE